MLEKYLIEVVSGKKSGPAASLTLVGLSFLEGIYLLLLRTRYFLYNLNIVKSGSLDCQVVSVGNITAGGTGKTPVVRFLAEALYKKGKRVVIVSRGYGANNQEPLIVSEGRGPLVDVKTAGDEAYMLSQLLPQIPLVIGKDRLEAGRLVVNKFQPEIILLDDGFQHWRLERDLDIVVIDAFNPFGFNRLLPRGFLREPLTALKRAGVFIISKADYLSPERIKEIRRTLQFYNREAIILTSSYCPSYLRLLQTGGGAINLTPESNDYLAQKTKFLELEEIKGKRVLAFSGIGNPDSFVKSLEGIGARVVERVNYPDHYRYNEEDFKRLSNRVQSGGIDHVVTTEKDAVKFTSAMLQHLTEILVLGIELKLSDESKLLDRITQL